MLSICKNPGHWCHRRRPRTSGVAVKLPLGALESPIRTPKPKKNMTRRCGANGGVCCCRCGAVGFWCDVWHKCRNMTTRHATHPPAVPMVELDVEGSSGWGFANGPLDGRGNRGSNPQRRRCRSTAYTTRPSMSLMGIWQNLFTWYPPGSQNQVLCMGGSHKPSPGFQPSDLGPSITRTSVLLYRVPSCVVRDTCVTGRAATGETEDPGGGVVKFATSEYTGDNGGGDCGATGDTGEYPGLSVTDRATHEYTDDA